MFCLAKMPAADLDLMAADLGADARLDQELTDCFTVGAHGGAHVMRLDRAAFAPGDVADFMLLRAECTPQVVVDMPQRDLVVHAGRMVARAGELV